MSAGSRLTFHWNFQGNCRRLVHSLLVAVNALLFSSNCTILKTDSRSYDEAVLNTFPMRLAIGF